MKRLVLITITASLIGGCSNAEPEAISEAKPAVSTASATASSGEMIVKPVTYTIGVEGMSCGGCVASVEQALKGIDGVKTCSVSLEEKEAVVEVSDEVNAETLLAAIEQAHFEATLKTQ